MDTTGKIYIGIIIAAMIGVIVGFYFLSKKGPRGAVLIAGAVLFFCGMSIPENNSRGLLLLGGTLQLSGIIGGILGIIDFFRKRPKPAAPDDSMS